MSITHTKNNCFKQTSLPFPDRINSVNIQDTRFVAFLKKFPRSVHRYKLFMKLFLLFYGDTESLESKLKHQFTISVLASSSFCLLSIREPTTWKSKNYSAFVLIWLHCGFLLSIQVSFSHQNFMKGS